MRTLGIAGLLLVMLATPGVCAGYDDLNIGIAAYNRTDSKAAIAAFDKALAAGDLIPDQQYVAHLERGTVHAALGELDAAIADFTACIELRPDDLVAHGRRGEIFLKTGDNTMAQKDMAAVIASNPQDVGAYLLLAEADFHLGKLDEAEASLSRAPSSNSYVWLWRAMTRLKQGKAIDLDELSSLKGGSWTKLLIGYFRSDVTEDMVRTAAATGSDQDKKAKTCEADFYLGEWRLLHGDAAGGKALIQNAAASCPAGFIERSAAQAELKNAS